MRTAPVYDFPPFDTGLFIAAEFLLSAGNARLLIKVAEHSDIVLLFNRVRWHAFTAIYNCSAEQVKSAYFKVVRLDDSDRVGKFITADRAASKAYSDFTIFGYSWKTMDATSSSRNRLAPAPIAGGGIRLFRVGCGRRLAM
jgi:hypothetical protein